MASRSCPWQHEWKRPLWQKANQESDSQKSYNDKLLGSPLCSTSARVSYEEVQKSNWYTHDNRGSNVTATYGSPTKTTISAPQLVTPQESSLSFTTEYLVPVSGVDLDSPGGCLMDDSKVNKNDDFILTVTLFSSSSSFTKKKEDTKKRNSSNRHQDEEDIGDVILLEIIQSSAEDQGNVKRKKSRILRWPGSALREMVTDESEDDDSGKDDQLKAEQEAVEETKEETEKGRFSNEDKTPPQQEPHWYEKIKFPWLGKDQIENKQKKKKSKPAPEKHIGLVSVALCRKPPQDGNALLFDALDVVNMMSLGLLSNNLESSSPLVGAGGNDNDPASDNKEKNGGGGGDERENRNTPNIADNTISQPALSDLVLCCLTKDGRVHFYDSPMKLFFQEDQKGEDLMVLELASLLMGSAMLNQIQDSLLPLSQPDATLDLSVPLGRMKTKELSKVQKEKPKSTKLHDGSVNTDQQQKPKQEKVPLSSKAEEPSQNKGDEVVNVETVSLETKSIEVDDDSIENKDVAVQKDQEDQGLWDGSVWDATVEPTSVLFRTQHNSPTFSIAAFEYVAIAGQGVRKRRRKIITKTTKHKRIAKSATSSPTSSPRRTKTSETKNDDQYSIVETNEKPPNAVEGNNENEELLHWADDLEDGGSKDKTNEDEGAAAWWNEPVEGSIASEDPPTETEDHKRSEAPIEPEDDAQDNKLNWESPSPRGEPVGEKVEKTKVKTEWVEYYESGGFITFISLRHFAEERTVYLPFIPKEVSPVVWGDMRFIFVLGDEEDSDETSSPMAVVIRVDASGVTKVPCGEVPLFDTLPKVKRQQRIDLTHALRKQDSIGDGIGDEIDEKQTTMCSIRRFQPIPIALPIRDEGMSANMLAAPVAVSSAFVDPPGIAVVYSTLQDNQAVNDASDSDTVVALHTLTGLDFVSNATVAPRSIGRYRRSGLEHRGEDSKTLTVQTAYQSGHLARIPCRLETRENAKNLWFFHVGQGWSLVGIERRVYFVCWEGATEAQGAFVVELDHGSNAVLGDISPLKHSRMICNILPLHTFFPVQSFQEQGIELPPLDPTKSVALNLPFTSPYSMPSMRWMNSFPSTRSPIRHVSVFGTLDPDLPPPPLVSASSLAFGENESVAGSASVVDGVVVEALDSISNLDYSDMGPSLTPNVPKRHLILDKEIMSKQEKSKRLLRHCSSWTQLESTQENRAALGGQVPIISVRLGTKPEDHFVLTLRRVFIENGAATPFNQVLSWLCHRKEYFCAASIGLDLLGDVDGLRDLRRSVDNTVLAEGRANLEGLLDGIVPLDIGTASRMAESTITQLADMTVGCLVKGGLPMSNTLEGLLGRNIKYDPARASLMLSAAATCSVSGDHILVSTVMGKALKEKEAAKAPIADLLWPIRCLLRIAIARDFLPTALLLLNESIPDELRRRKRLSEPASTPMPSLELCTSIVTMVVASAPEAAGRLLELIDEQTRTRYWESLSHDTQLALALIEIEGKFPLLRESEIRSWVLRHLHGCIETDSQEGDDSNSLKTVPSDWLKKLCDACIKNAGCNLKQLSTKSAVSQEDTDGIQKHLEELQMTQNALVSSPGSGGLDFDIIIPALLLLESRGGILWKDGVLVSTQAILDAACYLAGRHGAEESAFPFDASTVMRQCALVDNVSAGANLIGGKDGLVLKCCDVLIEGCGTSMDEAESFILDERLSIPQESIAEHKERSFAITDGHRHVLWLLDEHVLSIKTFGEFETIHIRGRVDPVFASHACFRTWLRLNSSHSATEWLVSWLRTRLGIDNTTISKKRLACAAIARALMWPTDRSTSMDPGTKTEIDEVLATALGIESKFLVQISQACCGLIEAIPPSLANDVFRHKDHPGAGIGVHVQVDV